MKPRIMTIYGTRPEAVKVAPVLHELVQSEVLESIPVVTGQHREMLDQVNRIFGLAPVMDLDVFEPGQGLNRLMSKMFERIDDAISHFKPDAILVQGDTCTVTAGAMAGFYRSLPIVHLEAGLRSNDIFNPFPEEANRQLTSRIATLHLAPTRRAANNLLAEGISADAVVVTGNTVIDALLTARTKDTPFTDPRVADAVASGPVILLTTHRRENWGGAMENIGRAMARIARRFPDHTVIFPAHLNPIVRDAVLPHLESVPNVVTTEPMGYGEFTRLLAACRLAVTDSGGVQEEAPSLGKPVLVTRENTERPEAVHAGTVELVGTDEERIYNAVVELLTDPAAYAAMAGAVNPYGDGQAAKRCVAAIAELLGVGTRQPEFAPDA